MSLRGWLQSKQEPTGVCICEVSGRPFLGNPKSGKQICFEEWNKLTTEERIPYYHPKYLDRKGALKVTKAFEKRYGLATIRQVDEAGLVEALNAAPPVRNINYGIQHHTANQGQAGLGGWQNVQNYHVYSNGWSDIGYHLLFDRDGSIYLGRPFERMGAHVGPGYNEDTIGYSIAGNFNIDVPTAELGSSLKKGWTHCSNRYSYQDRVRPTCHRDVDATACPGNSITDDWLNAVAAGGVVPNPQPQPTPEPTPTGAPEVVRTSPTARDSGFASLPPIPTPPFTFWDWVTNTIYTDSALGVGDISDAVPLVEDGLDFLWSPDGKAGGLPYKPRTNNFDESTAEQVSRFQNENGGRFPALLPADGLVGINTTTALQTLITEKWNSLHPPVTPPVVGEVFRVIELSTGTQMGAYALLENAQKMANQLRDENKQSYGVKSSVSMQIVYTATYTPPVTPPVEPPIEPPTEDKIPNWFIKLIQDFIAWITSWISGNK